MLIFHVSAREDWHVAETSGSYQLSTRGKTLAEVGYIHCSTADQVTRVANLIYRGVNGLVLLVIDRARVTSPIRDESPETVGPEHTGGPRVNAGPERTGGRARDAGPERTAGRERFPHIYGPLNLDAVVEVLPFEPNPDGSFTLPDRAVS